MNPEELAKARQEATEAAIRRMHANREHLDRFFSPEVQALIDPDAPEVIGRRGPVWRGQVWRLRRVRPRKRHAAGERMRGARQPS